MSNSANNLIAAALFVCLLAPAVLRADDWPQWLGPRRDGIWRERGLVTEFPAAGPKVLWRAPVGGGYAGPAVAGGRVYVTDYARGADAERPANPFQRITQPGVERVLCIDQHSGKIIWQHPYKVAYTMSYSAGPRATPIVDGNRVFTLGGEGDLVCLHTANGNPIWSKHISDEKSPTPMWGFASHPLIEGDKLICLTGGSDPAHGRGVVTAFNKQTGEVLWSALSGKEPGYAAPIICRAGNVTQLIIWDPDVVCSLDPQTGTTYWRQPFGPVQMGLSIVTPRFDHDPHLGDVLFVSSQYDGSLLLKLDDRAPKASVLWQRAGKNQRNSEALHTLMCPPVLRDGYIYGIDAKGQLRCLDMKTGDRLWSTFDATTYDAGEQSWAAAFLIPLGETGSRFLIANEHGDLLLADLNPKGYHQVSRAHVLEPTNTDPGRPVVWSSPACAGKCVFWRNDKEMVCISMGAPHAGS